MAPMLTAIPDLPNAAFSLACFALSFFALTETWRSIRERQEEWDFWRQYRRWPTVLGRVQSVEFDIGQGEGDAPTYFPRICYTYTVHGMLFQGHNIGPRLGVRHCNEAQANEIAAQYLAGSQWPVAYDPDDPTRALLERSDNPPATIAALACSGLISAAASALVGAVALLAS